MEKKYVLKFTEDEYWAIYEPSFQRKSTLFNHKSTQIWFVLTLIALLGTISCLSMYVKSKSEIVGLSCIVCLSFLCTFGIRLLLQGRKLAASLKRIRAYYETIQHGIELSYHQQNMQFTIHGKKELIHWNECKKVTLEKNFIQFDFFTNIPILIPKGRQSQSSWKQLEADLSTFQ
jgi:hypothetical protein